MLVVGGRSFGAAVLRQMLTLERDTGWDVEVVGAWTREEDPLADAALEEGLPVLVEPTEAYLREQDLDLLVCAHLHTYLGEWARETARLGAVGYHPSLLPRHRGRDAVRWTIHMGDPIAGGTVYRMDEGVDTGPILAQDWCHVRPGWTASDLWREELFPMGLRLLSRVACFRSSGEWAGQEQDEAVATWEPSWERPGLGSS